jgi:hypothetical protein
VVGEHHDQLTTWWNLHRPAHQRQRWHFTDASSWHSVTRQSHGDAVALCHDDPSRTIT